MPSDDDDVPIRVDFHDLATARTWIEETRIKRPYRPRFFAAFCAAMASRPNLRILDLGSGPGQTRPRNSCPLRRAHVRRARFSTAMHEIAAEHLGELANHVTFVTRDFRESAWPSDLGTFDAIVTLQAAYETRHKRHLVPLLKRARTIIAPAATLLYADHYLAPEANLPTLLPARADQPLALESAGFVDVQLRYEEGTWRYRAERTQSSRQQTAER